MKTLWLLLLGSMVITAHAADSSRVLHWDTGKNIEMTYKVVYKSLEDHKYYVVFEPDIQANLERFAERWGEDYNRNRLQGIRAMVFCNGWYANAVGNADPDLLALCPLHVTLVQRDGNTRILFVRPSQVALGSKAAGVAAELEQDVVKAIETAVAALK